jgi:RecB family exonuclease
MIAMLQCYFMAWSYRPVRNHSVNTSHGQLQADQIGLTRIGFNGYDAGIMTVIFADDQFVEYYDMDSNKQGIVATAPWATTGRLAMEMS